MRTPFSKITYQSSYNAWNVPILKKNIKTPAVLVILHFKPWRKKNKDHMHRGLRYQNSSTQTYLKKKTRQIATSDYHSKLQRRKIERSQS